MSSESVTLTAAVRNQLYIQQLSTQEYRTILPFLNELELYLIDLLDIPTNTIETAKRYNEMRVDVNAKVSVLMDEWVEQYQLDLFDVAGQQGEFATMVLNRASEGFESVLPANEQLYSAARLTPMILNGNAVGLSEYLKQFTNKQAEILFRPIKNGYALGRTTQQIVADIRRKKTGAIALSKREAEMLVRTSLNHVATMARAKTYEDNDDVLEGYRLVVTLDSRTSKTCQFYGATPDKIYLFTDRYQPKPPFHPFCRTTDEPVIKEEYQILGDEGIKRAAVGANGGTVINGDPSYYEFLKTQPASFQDEALGRTRGLIFRNSGLTQEEFKKATYTQFGKPLTIEQMREKSKEIAEYLDSDGFKRAFQ